jgi:hypothetical protein
MAAGQELTEEPVERPRLAESRFMRMAFTGRRMDRKTTVQPAGCSRWVDPKEGGVCPFPIS